MGSTSNCDTYFGGRELCADGLCVVRVLVRRSPRLRVDVYSTSQ